MNGQRGFRLSFLPSPRAAGISSVSNSNRDLCSQNHLWEPEGPCCRDLCFYCMVTHVQKYQVLIVEI